MSFKSSKGQNLLLCLCRAASRAPSCLNGTPSTTVPRARWSGPSAASPSTDSAKEDDDKTKEDFLTCVFFLYASVGQGVLFLIRIFQFFATSSPPLFVVQKIAS